MPVGRTFGTHLRCQVDWQAANDCVARLDNGRIQMGNELVNLHMLARSPFDGTGVAGDEVGGHEGMVAPTILQGISGKLAAVNGWVA